MSAPQPRRSWLAVIFLSPDEPRLRAGWRLLAHFSLLLIFLTLGALLTAGLPATGTGYRLLLEQGIPLAAITLATFVARRWLDRRTIASLGLTWNRLALQDLAVGIAIPGLQMGLIFILEWAFGWLRVEGTRFSIQSAGEATLQLGMMFLVFVMVGWQEELLSRGYWLQNLEDGLGLPGALIVSSILFSLGHLANPNVSPLAILGLVGAGLFLAYGYLATRQLWLPIGLHIGWNFFEGPVFSFPVSGLTQFFTLFDLNRTGPEWLTGGPFGPEAGLIQYPALLVAAWIIYRYSRQRGKRQTKN